MEPIVSPWTIYLLQQLSTLIGIFTTIGIFLFAYGFFPVLHNWTEGNDIDDSGYMKHPGWFVKFCGIIFLVVAALIPTKETAIGMIVAQKITPDNVKVATSVLRDAKNELKTDVIQLIQAIKDSSR